jgi:hypothetical protein
VRK